MSATCSLDDASFQLLELLLVLGAHLHEEIERRTRLLLIDLGDCEPHVNEYPVTGLDTPVLAVEQPDIDVSADARYVNLGQPIRVIDDLDDLTRDR